MAFEKNLCPKCFEYIDWDWFWEENDIETADGETSKAKCPHCSETIAVECYTETHFKVVEYEPEEHD